MAEAKAGGAKPKKQSNLRKVSAIKRTRQNAKRSVKNREFLVQMRTEIKALRKTLDAKNKASAEKLLQPTLRTIARMVSKGIVHKNKASRLQSRLTKQFKGL